ncbi:unnamed protein product [Mesocestoides corti]|uniref:BZIP domain-containing protein n=1 Tax=Mesocestoides corti TaxID=53468 RepID=A0A0R3UL25_MESCO|nr:unnamed protein product [Mesocestoides corti]
MSNRSIIFDVCLLRTSHQRSSKCELVTASCSLYNFGAGYNQPTTTKNLVDLDYLSEALPSTTSPDSTASDSEMSNSTLLSEENLGNWLSAEQANVSRDILTSPPSTLQQHTRTGETRAEARGTKLSSQKALTPSEKDLERRRKNNEASRKSRAQKKDRFLMDVLEVEHLRVENNRLRRFLAEVDSAIKEANDTLIAKFQYHLAGAPSPPL